MVISFKQLYGPVLFLNVGDQILTLCFELHWESTVLDHIPQVRILLQIIMHLITQERVYYSEIYLVLNIFLPIRYTAFILLYPVGVGPGESKPTILLKQILSHS